MRQSWDSYETVYYSTPVADFANMFVLVCRFERSITLQQGGQKTMACLSGKGHGKNWKDHIVLKLPLKSFAINCSPKNSLKMILSLKKCHKNPLLADNDPFPHCASWHSVAHMDVLMQNDIAHRLSPSKASWQVTIQDVTVKRDGFLMLESPLIRRIHSFRHRRQRALWYLSRGTGLGELVVRRFGECLTGQNRTETGQGRAGHGRMRTGKTAFLGFSLSNILVYCTGVSALPICPISQRTFFLPNFFFLA